MADDKKYYYLKLKENFFDSDALVLLESQKDGYLYSNILLKMYLKSLKNEGRLAFNNYIPYDIEMLATLTRHNPKTIKKALDIFRKLDLIEVLDNGVIYMVNIQDFIGKSSTEADRKRDYRKRIENEKTKQITDICPEFVPNLSSKYPPEIEIEKEKEINIEIEKDLLSTQVDTKDIFDYQSIVDLFNSICTSLPKVQKLPNSRKKIIKSASKEVNNNFESLFRKVENSDFLTGRDGKWSNCGFDWILKPQNLIKILEGNYDNKVPKAKEEKPIEQDEYTREYIKGVDYF